MNQRRLRANRAIRELTATAIPDYRRFIQPVFVDESLSERAPLATLSGVFSESKNSIYASIEADLANGISKFLLFPVPLKRGEPFDFSFVTSVLSDLKRQFGDRIWIAADVCLCAYTSHGHCGILSNDGSRVLNAESVSVLAQYAVELAKAGADCIAPSDMMDGRIGAIRRALDETGFDTVSIMSYAAKFQSQFYGPFRDACHSSPNAGNVLKDRKTYQISPANPSDALESVRRDAAEGADIVMVKPATHFSDLIYRIKQEIDKPVAAYHVSGEYQSIELLAQHGLADRASAHVEIWTSLTRAGAEIIISYAARNARKWLE